MSWGKSLSKWPCRWTVLVRK